ncbi:DUF305 domain-containing protein [Nocardia ninae]|uniref:DUF305 domain-containing protein n=2 Tax=Nocardia ninae TaxID=356145 RepID=A0A511M7D3_9NOCA|nr:hypothetical protein NN4_10380 [Nocardia ninae NBRC 108245]
MYKRSRTMKLGFTAFAVAVVALAGCGNDDEPAEMPAMTSGTTMPGMPHESAVPGNASRSDFNDADVTFLQMMYPHHAQAVEMADLVPSRSQDQRVLDLAAAIKQAQGPEMEQISTLLQQFGKPAPSADTMGHDMEGMMSQQQMSELKAMSGPEFDRMWLTMMIEHHSGAIDMAKKEQNTGTNADAKKIADAVVSSQQSEIDRMKGILGQN